MRRWNLSTATLLLILGLAGLVAFVVFASMFASRAASWTGFAADPLPLGVSATPVVVYEQGKDLWDWLQLLLVPLVLAIGGFLLTRTENRYALELQERREKETRRIEEERARDAALQAYLDQMTDLLLHESLLLSQPGDMVRTVARARTLTVLTQLDGLRKGRVVQFLREAKLCVLTEGKRAVISLSGADLSGANLYRVNLNEADLKGANLEGANLLGLDIKDALLQGANLTGANLTNANLVGSDFIDANLTNANFTDAILDGVVGLPNHLQPKH